MHFEFLKQIEKMIDLSKIATTPPKDFDKKKAKDETKVMAKEIGELVETMFAEKKKNLLVVFQGMDSSGKDGATREVFKYCSPSMVCAYSFGKPSDIEFAHDFLWRCHKVVPAKGKVQVFIRSHYEDVLIQRVHKWIDEERVTMRINAINAWEKLLESDNKTTVLKFYLHLSYEQQEKKLQERIDDPAKNYKHNPDDWKQREYWDEYRRCYEDAINRSEIPWFIAPVDSRTYRNYFIAKKTLETLKSMNMIRPTIADEQ